MKKIEDITGKVFVNKEGLKATVVSYEGSQKVRIRFEDGTEVVRKLQWLEAGVFSNGKRKNLKIHQYPRKYITRFQSIYFGMLLRCNLTEDLAISRGSKSYMGCTYHQDWNTSKSFCEWAEKQIGSHNIDWELDKDILFKGNKIYGPDTCCFVPSEVNVALTKSNAKRGLYPIGVRKVSKGRRFSAQIGGTKSKTHLGTFDTPEEAFFAYKTAKEVYIKSLALKYKDELDPRAFQALMSYEVEITD
jgi:hypothetical protein